MYGIFNQYPLFICVGVYTTTDTYILAFSFGLRVFQKGKVHLYVCVHKCVCVCEECKFEVKFAEIAKLLIC